jgi:transglutaminase-like putative cysteine protease
MVERFLKPTRSTGDGDANIGDFASQAVKLSPQGSIVARARLIHRAVLDKLSYVRKNDLKGASKALAEGTGECCDYAALFTAACRAQKIAARTVNGFHFGRDGWDLHVWAEFFQPQAGWIPCELSRYDPPARPSRERTDSVDDASSSTRELSRRSPDGFAGVTDRYLAVTRDLDLDVGLGQHDAFRLIQQYYFRFQGAVEPELKFELSGEVRSADEGDRFLKKPKPPEMRRLKRRNLTEAP